MRMMRKSGSSLTANHSRLTTARVIWAKRAASRKRRRQHTSTSQAQSPLPYISSVKESQPESRQKQTTLSRSCHSHKPNSETNAYQRINADNANDQCRPPFNKEAMQTMQNRQEDQTIWGQLASTLLLAPKRRDNTCGCPYRTFGEVRTAQQQIIAIRNRKSSPEGLSNLLITQCSIRNLHNSLTVLILLR